MCTSCFAGIPDPTIKLLVTSFAILYGQRRLTANTTNKWAKRITFGISFLISFALSLLAAFLLVLSMNDGFRQRNFANFIMNQNLRGSPLDEYRCSLLERGGIHGKVMEFGPGPGTNFKCFQNSTAAKAIREYVAVEPNTFFEDILVNEKKKYDLKFPLQVLGVKGEKVDIPESSYGSFDTVIFTHVLCSVDSPEVVLANGERMLKRGGKMLFMEHVTAEEGTSTWFAQQVFGPILYIFGNGCTFRSLRREIEQFTEDRFSLEIEDFLAPMPWFLKFVRPHISGVAVKK